MKHLYSLIIALFVINSATAQWFPQNSGTTQDLNSVYFTDENTGYAVGDSGTILKTTNGGTNWITLSAGTSKALNSVIFTSNGIGYAAGDSGTILKTTNGGVNWEIQTSNTSVHLYSVHFPFADTGYAAGGWLPGMLQKTTNGGTDWATIFIDTTGFTFYSVFFTDANTGYLVGSLGWAPPTPIILKTTNGGIDWVTKSFGFYMGIFYSVCFLDANTGYVAGWTGDIGTGNGCLFKTTNGGNDWIEQSSCIGYLSKSVQFLNADTGFITSDGYFSEGAILKTTNGGLNINGQISPTFSYSSPLNSVYFTDAVTGYVVGGDGTILKTTDGGGFPVGIDKQHQTAIILSIYPNPVTDIITIETPAKGSLSIRNTSGQAILQKTITEPTTTIDVSSLPSGMYLVKMIAEKGVQVGKFVKQ